MNPSLKDYLQKSPSSAQWQKIGIIRRAGVLAPLFSLYSRESIGIGDFCDLRLFIDWAARAGNSIVQLLPVNETGGQSCPYDAISSFALEPVYASLKEVSRANGGILESDIRDLKKHFPAGGPHLDYSVKKEKDLILRKIYAARKDDPEAFVKFKSQNAYWLEDFTLYKALKDAFGGRPWYEWEDKFKKRDAASLSEFAREHSGEIVYQQWLQWQLYEQFKSVKAYAQAKGVFIKGDLPILVSRDSSDVWAHPEFFKLEFAAGAPPDMYCAKGQRWGMPTYNWENIAADGYRYLKERLKYAENFYDIIRIDHAVGIFRIWSIPVNEPPDNLGTNGHFDPADESRWRNHGREILALILKSTGMLLCAEDLGIIPSACPKTLAELGIPGNDVQRWTKDWKIKHDFLAPAEYRALSVAMLSTHDTTNWPAWWEYEAGTVDEALFTRKAAERGIDFARVKNALFDPLWSSHGRLRWRRIIKSAGALVEILGRKKEELADFIDLYENSYLEKEKLWKHLGVCGRTKEESNAAIARAALKISLDAASIFCVNTLVDWLYLGGLLKGQPYRWRINTPGTVSSRNWSLVMPLSLEELLDHKITKEIYKMNAESGRI